MHYAAAVSQPPRCAGPSAATKGPVGPSTSPAPVGCGVGWGVGPDLESTERALLSRTLF